MILEDGDFVRITGGLDADSWAPIPKDLIGCVASAFPTGSRITETIDSSKSWGCYHKQKLPGDGVEEMRLRVNTRGPYYRQDFSVEGLFFKKLSPLEILAHQAD